MPRTALLVLTLAGLATGLGGCHRSPSAAMPGDAADHRPWSGLPSDAVIVARGAGLSWSAHVGGGRLVYANADGPERVSIPVTRFAGRGGVSFAGEIDGQALTLAVGEGPCRVSPGRTWPYGATLRLGERVLNGCARTVSGSAGHPAKTPESRESRTPLP